jgi:16S rRNA (adenine1518-N6/adenine1519-N6)-dimethyltransferase
LTDNRVIERIVATIAPKFNDNLLEIGPGQGAMTLPLLECQGF